MAAPTSDTHIIIKGAKVHNLKNISVEIPRDKLVVITGPSGSGKSSLAFDTIYAEGQRRYVESLSTYARQFLEQAQKPDVESVTGLSPTISIVQKTTSYNPRSTVGTVTELYDYLRVLYAKVGKPICWKCGEAIKSQSHQQIVDQILDLPPGSKLALLSPVSRGRKGEHQRELIQLRQMGFVRARINGQLVDLSEDFSLDSKKKNDIEVYVDRIVISSDTSQVMARVSESVEMALRLGKGEMILQNTGTNSEQLFSEKFACSNCGISYPEPEPRTFSFNSPVGACPDCDGLGVEPIPEAEEGRGDKGEPSAAILNEIDIPDREIQCKTCKGARLRKEALHFFVAGQNISAVCLIPLSDLLPFFDSITLTDRERRIVDRLLREIRSRLKVLNDLGVGYLSLARTAQTLSGGEAQRIRLATQIGSHLVGVTYVLDEPSIGLHPRDNDRLLGSLKRLRDLGNTVIVVEHDRDTMEVADWILDIGPGAGKNGGEVIAAGEFLSVLKVSRSETAAYLSGRKSIELPQQRRTIDLSRALTITGASQNNLQSIDAVFPLGTLTCVTGISGSGKSTLVIDTLYRLLLKSVYKVDTGPIAVSSVRGLELVDKVVDINQKPIGRTPRSNPATYIGLFTGIRDLFASLPESQIRGYKPGRFSFNVKGGRCEACEGDGVKRVEMHFLPDVYVTCDACNGKRFNRETLSITFKNKNIAEVLDLSFEDAAAFFENIPQLQTRLQIMNEVGLGYLHLGQAATTLSGGEAQRVKLARELARRGTGKTVYILDEPTTGLHFEDIRKLISILQSLVNQGNTVIVIEHNLDVIKIADFVIDMGPEGGAAGGLIVASGTPEAISKTATSATGKFLKRELRRDTKKTGPGF